MKLLALRFENLFSLGKGEIVLTGRGLTLISGFSRDENTGNGAGKSSLANKAILFTLFGETAGGLKADKVTNRHMGKKKCFGEIDFLGPDGKTYTVHRARPASLTLKTGDSDVSASTAKETQKLIDSLLGFDFKTFVQTSFFGQGRTIHYPSLVPKEQKAVLENILPMEEVDVWATLADKEAKKLSPQLKVLNEKYSIASGALESLKSQLARTDKDGFEFEGQRAVKVQGAKEALASVHESFKPSWETLGEAPGEVNVEDINASIKEMEKQLGVATISQAKAEESRDAARHSESTWSNKVHTLEREVTDLMKEERCPTCFRDYDEDTLSTIRAKLTVVEGKYTEASNTYDQCNTALTHYENQRSAFQKSCLALVEARDGYRAQLTVRTEYDQKEEVLIAREEAMAATAQATLSEWEGATNPHLEPLKRIQGEVDEQTEAVTSMEQKRSTLGDEIAHLTHWREVYGKELKLKLFEDACPFLDDRTTYHLTRLNNPQIHCDFSTVKRLATGEVKEEFDVRAWSETGGDGFGSLSGGEQQMVSFAIGLALSDLARRVSGSDSGFLILDEPLTELCPKNAESVYEYLTAEIENGRDTVFLISNDESLKSLIHNRVHVEKNSGVSNVVDHE